MSYTMLSTTILMATVVLVCIKAASGYKAGAARSAADLALIVFSASIGSVISVASSSTVGDYLYESVSQLEFYTDIVSEFGDIHSITLILTGIVGAVILFLPVFLVIYAIGSLIVSLIFKAHADDVTSRDDGHIGEDVSLYRKSSNSVGAMIGAVCGAAMVLITFAPMAGLLQNAEDLIGAFEVCTGEEIEIEGSEELFNYSDDVMLNIVYEAGGRGIFDALTVVEHDGRSVSLSREIEAIRALSLEESSALVSDIIAGDVSGAEAMLEAADRSLFVEAFMQATVKSAAGKWIAREPYMGVSRPVLGEGAVFDRFLDEILYVCVSSTRDNFSDNMLTLINVTRIFSEWQSDLLSGDYSVMISAIADGNILESLRAEFDKNPNMRHVVYTIDNMLVSAIADEIGDTKYSEYDRDTLYRRIANALNSTRNLPGEERISGVRDALGDAFEEYESYLPDSIGEEVARILIDHADGLGSSIRSYDVESFFARYMSYLPIEIN